MNQNKSARMSRTVSAVRAVLENNPDIPSQRITDSLDIIVGNRKAIDYKDQEKIERPYTRAEVARLLGKSVKTVDHYAQIGKLKKVMRTDSRRSVGYTAASVKALVEGRVQG